MADRVGFEPTVPFGGTHDFQSCAFDHSAIYPSWSVPNLAYSKYFRKSFLDKFLFFYAKIYYADELFENMLRYKI